MNPRSKKSLLSPVDFSSLGLMCLPGTQFQLGFSLKKRENDEIWIQFKYEKLSYFCYTCGCLNHVTGRCKLGNPAMVTSINRVRAKLYGPWICANHPDSLLFINPAEDGENRLLQLSKEKTVHQSIDFQDGMGYYGAKLAQTSEIEGLKKGNHLEELQMARQISCEVDALHATLDRQVLFQMEDLRASMFHQIRFSNFDPMC